MPRVGALLSPAAPARGTPYLKGRSAIALPTSKLPAPEKSGGVQIRVRVETPGGGLLPSCPPSGPFFYAPVRFTQRRLGLTPIMTTRDNKKPVRIDGPFAHIA